MINKKILISSEDEAWDFLKTAFQNVDNIPAHVELEFDGWPTFHMKLNGDIFHGTMPTSVMSGIIDLQNNFYRYYAEAKYNKYDIRSLTQEDKDLLEINIKVKDGSTDASTVLAEAFSTIAKELATKMSADQILIVTIALGVLYFGKSVISNWLETRKEEKALELQKFAQTQETERLKLMADVAKNNSKVRDIIEDSENAINSLLKATLRADTVEIQGKELDNETIKKLINKPRKTSTDIRLDGSFLVFNVDAGDIDGHKIKLKHIQTHSYLMVLIQEGDISINDRNRIQEAIWEKKPINLSINAKELRGEITSASILRVGDIEV